MHRIYTNGDDWFIAETIGQLVEYYLTEYIPDMGEDPEDYALTADDFKVLPPDQRLSIRECDTGKTVSKTAAEWVAEWLRDECPVPGLLGSVNYC